MYQKCGRDHSELMKEQGDEACILDWRSGVLQK
jgi:hypothetical protein